ncbi:MAG: hypothetical protein KDA42_18645, partial [Planctomycetales bacterium]|nr:hypothetical protein [Planctomycetales bacterium]
ADRIEEDIYSTGLAIIFLCSLDASEYHDAILAYQQSLTRRQKPHGGWGYPNRETGDTSMTQYGVLSAWEAKQVGFPVPVEVIEKVTNWLMRTQDPNGAWGYQGNDPGNFELIKQAGVRHTMAAAGIGSSYICADMLGLVQMDAEPVDDSLPPALKLVVDKKPDEQAGPVTNKVAAQTLLRTINRANGWFAANFEIETKQNPDYYLYALERYMSFRELAEGKRPKEPIWYNQGFEYLKRTQQDDGSWQGGHGPVIATAFDVLFLLRSTKKSIDKAKGLGEGTLVGGRGLPTSFTDLQLRRGRVVGAGIDAMAEDMVRILNDPEHPDYDYLVDNPDGLLLADDGAARKDQTQRLVRIAKSGPPEARRVAVRALARNGGFDVVPTLIYALSDPNMAVMREARDGLRFVSRKFDGFGLGDKPTKEEVYVATEQWKAWYRTIRPQAYFDN